MAVDRSTPARFGIKEGLSYMLSPDKQKKIETSNLVALLPPTATEADHTLLYLSPASQPTANPSLSFIKLHGPPQLLVERYKLDPSSLPPHLRRGYADTHVIVSTKSGACAAETYYEDILRPLLERLNVEFTLHATTRDDSVRQFGQSLANAPYYNADPVGEGEFNKLIILLGGDTTIQEFINAMSPGSYRVKILLAVLPLGTANALASSLNITLATLLHGTPHHLPTFTATFSPGVTYVTDEGRGRVPIYERYGVRTHGGGGTVKGCVVCSYGFHASLVGGSDTVAFRRFGRERFGMLAQQLLKGQWGYTAPTQDTEGEAQQNERPMHVYRARITLYKKNAEGDITSFKEELLESADNKHAYLMLPMIPRLEPTFTISPETSTTLTPISDITAAKNKALLERKKEEKEEEQDTTFAAYTSQNNPNTAGPAPDAHIVYIPSVPAPELMDMMQAAYAGGKHVERDNVGYWKAQGFRIDMLEPNDVGEGRGRWRWICIDGKIVEVEEGGFVEVTLDDVVDDWGILWRSEE